MSAAAKGGPEVECMGSTAAAYEVSAWCRDRKIETFDELTAFHKDPANALPPDLRAQFVQFLAEFATIKFTTKGERDVSVAVKGEPLSADFQMVPSKP